MNVTLALLADFANKSADGKLNILGAFDRIFAERFPAMHPEMKLVIRFEMHPAEITQKKSIQIQLRDETGKQIFELSGDMSVQPPQGIQTSGEMIHIDQILAISNLVLERAGSYEFVIMVNGEVKSFVPFKVVLRQRA